MIRNSIKGLLLVLVLLLALPVMAQTDDPTNNQDGFVDQGVVHGDGRLNQIHNFGGAAVYCVNALTGRPTLDYNLGGIRVADGNGQELLFISAERINEVGVPEQNTLLGETETLWFNNTPLSVYRLSSGEFQMNGFDNHAKLVEFIWNDCQRVGVATDEIDGKSQNEFGNVFR